jgi:hypothetical protein
LYQTSKDLKEQLARLVQTQRCLGQQVPQALPELQLAQLEVLAQQAYKV